MGARDRKPLKLNKKSLSKLGDKNPQWKGKNVGFGQLHSWVFIRLENNGKCNKCKQYKKCDLANKGIYDRNLKNWEWLCRRCHMISDGRLKNLIAHKISIKERNRIKKLYRTGQYSYTTLSNFTGYSRSSIYKIMNNRIK